MSADRLREAARVLRERAAGATKGPWGVRPRNDGGFADVYSDAQPLKFVVAQHVANTRVDAHYIATVHPGFGLAVAAWLDSVHDALVPEPGRTIAEVDERMAMAMVDAILGDAS